MLPNASQDQKNTTDGSPSNEDFWHEDSRYNLMTAGVTDFRNIVLIPRDCIFPGLESHQSSNEDSTMLKIGLLLCDDVDSDAQVQYSDYGSMFQIGIDPDCSLIHLVPIRCFDGDPFPEEPGIFAGYVISGSKHGVYDDLPWINDLLQFIRDCWNSRTRMIGVCFGHQAIAHALGGRTEKSAFGWGFGIQSATVLDRQAWMTDYEALDGDNYNLVVIHQDQIIKMPPMFRTIATSHFCPNSMIVSGTTMLGVQGHPEFSADYCRLRADYRYEAKLIDTDVYQSAVQSLNEHSLHSRIILKWMQKFLLLPQVH